MNQVKSDSQALAFPPAARLSVLPSYIFARLDELKANAVRSGSELIDLGLGNPDGATPEAVIEALSRSLVDVRTHGYPPFAGRTDFKEAIAAFMFRRYGVKLDPAHEVLPLIGSKEGLAHLALAYVDHKDLCLVPNPCYPVHCRGPLLAGGVVHPIPLKAETNFLPDFEAIPIAVAAQSKLLILNYPNNPTAAMGTDWVMEKAIALCRENGILLVHDLAYGELYFGKRRPRSLLEFPGAKEVGVEFHTLSKTFNMAGWRVGFVAGNHHVIRTLYSLKTNIDYGVFAAIQLAGVAALELPDSEIQEIRDTYRQRRDLIVSGLKAMGWPVTVPEATMYIWLEIPRSLGMTSAEFAEALLSKTGVIVTPGVAFGSNGERFIRISMVAPHERLQEALDRWKSSGLTP